MILERRKLAALAGLGVAILVTTSVVLAQCSHDDPAQESASAPGRGGADTSVTSTPSAPTTDIFGNRLEVPADPAGMVLPQEPATRPDPTQPDYLKAAPHRLQWQRGWGGAALPVSGSDGPARIDDGVASGFAHTPQGAALAACDALARAFSAPEGLWQNVVRTRFSGGGSTLSSKIAVGRAETPHVASYLVVPEGVRVLPSYQPDFAVVQIAVRASGTWAYGTWPMTWEAGDWRVRVPVDVASLWQPAAHIESLTDFGFWKGVPS